MAVGWEVRLNPQQMWDNTDEATRVKWLIANRFVPEWCNVGYDGLPDKIKTVIVQNTRAQVRSNWTSLGIGN
jgi:hypothetical protein